MNQSDSSFKVTAIKSKPRINSDPHSVHALHTLSTCLPAVPNLVHRSLAISNPSNLREEIKKKRKIKYDVRNEESNFLKKKKKIPDRRDEHFSLKRYIILPPPSFHRNQFTETIHFSSLFLFPFFFFFLLLLLLLFLLPFLKRTRLE